jgi:hypothetical protein
MEDIIVKDKDNQNVVIPKNVVSDYKGYKLAGEGTNKSTVEGGWVAVNAQMFVQMIDEIDELKSRLAVEEA